MKVYDRIEFVFDKLHKPLSAADFRYLDARPWSDFHENALAYVGCSESALGRRMREMAVIGRLRSWYRTTASGKRYKVFERVFAEVAA